MGIQALSLLSRKKSGKSPESKHIEPDDWLKEVNIRNNDDLSVQKESKIFSSGASASQYSISSEEFKKCDFDEQLPTTNESFSCNHDYENFQMTSTLASFNLESFSKDRKMIVLKDLSGVKIYEDIFPEIDEEKLKSFLEESLATTVTVYEEIRVVAPDNE